MSHKPVRTKRRASAATVVGLGLSLVVAACGGDDDGGSDGGGGGEEKGDIVVGGANAFTEAVILEEAYKALLEDAGYNVTIQAAETREIYIPLLESGEIDVVPEFAATMAEYLNAAENGPDAPSEAPIATSDAQETVEAMRPLAEARGLVVLEPSEAASQNGFAVSEEFATENGISTLSDLGALGEPIVLAGTEECPERPFCEPGLEQTYGIEITEVVPLGYGTRQTKDAVVNGEAQLGQVGTTDGTLSDLGLVLLEDDKNLQLADNVVPVVNAETAEDGGIAEALAEFHATLTTEDLAMMQAQVTSERQREADVAQAYLEDKGML